MPKCVQDIDELYEMFLESASRHFVPEEVMIERRNECKALVDELELEPINYDSWGEDC